MDFHQLFENQIWIPILSYLGLVLADTILGVLKALRNGSFDWNELGNWVKKVGIQGVGLVVLGVLSTYKVEVYAAFYPAVVMMDASVTNAIIEKISSFFE